MAGEQRTTQLTHKQTGESVTVPADSQGRPKTIRYVGTDHHTRKYMTGKFFSNVGPPKSDYRQQLDKEDWQCLICGRENNRFYLLKCYDCMNPRGSVPENGEDLQPGTDSSSVDGATS